MRLNLPERDKWSLCITGIFLISILFYKLQYQPQMTKINDLKAKLEQQKQTLQRNQLMERQLPALEEEVRKLTNKAQEADQQAPGEEDRPTFLRSIADLAEEDNSRVLLSRVNFSEDISKEEEKSAKKNNQNSSEPKNSTDIEEKNYRKVVVDIEIIGLYNHLTEYVEMMEIMKRVVSFRQVAVVTLDRTLTRANIRLVIFTTPEELLKMREEVKFLPKTQEKV